MNEQAEIDALRLLLRRTLTELDSAKVSLDVKTHAVNQARAEITDLRRQLDEAHEDLRQSSRLLVRLDAEKEAAE